jgi:hypothetical protein
MMTDGRLTWCMILHLGTTLLWCSQTMASQGKPLWSHLPLPLLTDGITAEKFIHYLNTENPESVRDLSPYFASQGFGKLWTAIYRSESQRAKLYSPERPRILVVEGKSFAQFALAYGPCPGVPLKANRKSDEVLEFWGVQPASRSIELREVYLPGRNAPSSSRVEISEPNPERCLKCHGEDPRPLIQPYNTWPFWIGSLSRSHFDIIQVGSPEEEIATQIYRKVKSDPAFAYLKWKDKAPQIFGGPYGNEPRPELIGVEHSLSDAPNSDINDLFSNVNSLRVSRMLLQAVERNPEYFPALHEFIAMEMFPETEEGTSPLNLLAALPNEGRELKLPPASDPELCSSLMEANFSKVAAKLETTNPVRDRSYGPLAPYIVSPTAKLQILGTALKLNPRDFSMSLDQPYNLMAPSRHFLIDVVTLIKIAQFDENPASATWQLSPSAKSAFDTEAKILLDLYSQQ